VPRLNSVGMLVSHVECTKVTEKKIEEEMSHL
jgi:hypothetical protein